MQSDMHVKIFDMHYKLAVRASIVFYKNETVLRVQNMTNLVLMLKVWMSLNSKLWGSLKFKQAICLQYEYINWKEILS